MKLHLSLDIPKLEPSITYADKMYLIGSCFTVNMHAYFRRHKFQVEQSAHGILFNPISVCKGLTDIADAKVYTEGDLFYLNEYWNTWFHHSDFSFLDQATCLEKINSTIQSHHEFLKQAKYVFITLGSAFAYWHLEKACYVSNNHRAPANTFRKDLLSVDFMEQTLLEMQAKLLALNPELKFVYTISPVRHIRDGVMENNRSKARLIEVVHRLTNTYYFPSYELVIDILRDHRFYDADMVHPNYLATQYVWQRLVEACMDEAVLEPMKQMEQLFKARHHKPKDIRSKAHHDFLQQHATMCEVLQQQFPYLDFNEELHYFRS